MYKRVTIAIPMDLLLRGKNVCRKTKAVTLRSMLLEGFEKQVNKAEQKFNVKYTGNGQYFQLKAGRPKLV